jgi:signal transduction histidine kinase
VTQLREQVESLEWALTRIEQGDSRVLDEAFSLLKGLRQGIVSLLQSQVELATLYEVGQEIASVLDLTPLLELILDRVIILVQAERGFIVLYDQDQDDFYVSVARQFAPEKSDDPQVKISQHLIRRVLLTREPIITTNAQEDPRFEDSLSIVSYQIRSVLAAPLIFQDELIGAIYVDTRFNIRPFQESDLALLSAVANQAAIAIHLARTYDTLQAKNRELEAALAELRETQEELIRAERLSAVGTMASSIIHDIKGPMTIIKGFAEILGEDGLPSPSRYQYSQTISKAIDGFVGMTQEILDYAHGESTLTMAPFEVGTLIEDLCQFLERDFSRKGIEIRTPLAFTGSITADQEKIRRALYNIAINAGDVLEQGGVFTIATRLVGNEVEFRLSDNGPGIPEQILDTLFEPFVTYDKSYGTGLGLAISKKIIEDHGGHISVKSKAGQGAGFIITLPCISNP